MFVAGAGVTGPAYHPGPAYLGYAGPSHVTRTSLCCICAQTHHKLETN